MAKAKCSSMQDFLVTFFVENRMVSRMLSEVLKNRNDRLFLETLGLPADVVIPFSQDNDVTSVVYMLKHTEWQALRGRCDPQRRLFYFQKQKQQSGGQNAVHCNF